MLQAPRTLDEPLGVAVGRYFHPQAIDKRAIFPACACCFESVDERGSAA
jgi:hypothetical protein